MTSQNRNGINVSEGFVKTGLKLHNVILCGIGLFVLLIVVIITELSKNYEIEILAVSVISVKTVVTEFGLAFIIAAIISVSTEEVHRRRFHTELNSRISQIQHDVFRSTYSRNLPSLFFNEVDEILFRSKFCHLDYQIEYIFKEPRHLSPSNPTQVMDVTIKHIFSMRNLNGIASEHCMRFQVHELLSSISGVCPSIESAYLYGQQTFSPQELTTINNDAVSVGGIRTFKIITNKVPPGEDVRVQIVLQSVKHADGFTFCRCSTPSSGLTVIAKFPPQVAEHRVGVDTAHRTTCKRNPHNPNGNEFSWVIEGAVLPSQGINFWWVCDS